VVVGQVLSDETGLPLPEATVVLETPSGPKTAESDARGGYSFPTGGAVARLQAVKAEMTAVEREVVVESGVGTVVLDSRLTPLGAPVTVGPDEQVLPKLGLPGPIPIELVLTVPAGAVSQPTKFRLTPLSAQGLPGLLPLGWSPLAAFDVRAEASVGPGLEATIEGLPDGTLHLVRFDTGSRAWTMAQAGLAPTSGALTVVLGGTGAWALVAPDADPAPALPAAGEVLPGVAQADLPPTAVGQAAVEPSVIPPSGGKATGRLFVESPQPLPSGTVVQAKVTEEFELASGKTASEEVRRQDILLFRAPLPAGAPEAAAGETVLHAALPVTPSRTFAAAAELVQGKVHVDVLAGRESVRGKTGGNKELTLQSGVAILSVPAASLAEDTVVDIQESALSPFLPATSDLQPLAEVVLDFTGAMLGTSAGLSIVCNEGTCPCAAGCAGDTLLVARVERVLGIPRLLVVALAEANGGRIAAVPVAGLPGIKEGGRYVFYRLSQPVGWVSGATTLASTTAPVGGAVVESNTLPFIGRSRLEAPYLLVARPGTAQVSATVPGTRLVASGSTTVVAGGPAEAAPLPLAFVGAATTATVTPADGTLAIAVSAQVEVEATAALDPSPTNLAKAKLFKGSEPVEVRLQLSLSGKRLALVPVKPLEVSTDYTFTATGLKDAEDEDVIVPSPVVFRTKDFVAPVYDVEAIVFSYPEEGITKVTAPKGSLPPFSEVLILNSSNGAVLWLQVDNEGCIGCLVGSNELPATIDDRLLVTITDPQGNVVTFERSKFVKADGTVAIGPGGGTVEGAGGVELRIPSGALEKGVELKVEGLTAEALLQQFPGQVPDLGKNDQETPLAKLAGGIKITSKDEPVFTKPIDLAFPLPDFTKAPEAERPPADKLEDAYFYVVRRLEGPCEDRSDSCAAADRKVLFQTIDHAFAECPEGKTTCEASQKKVVTASWPFGGYVDSIAGFAFAGSSFLIQSATSAYAYLMWTYDKTRPGEALAGVVTGKVLRTKWNPGATTPEYEPVKDKRVLVTAVDASGQRLLKGNEQSAVASSVDGSFTLWDPRYVGGTVRVAATLDGVAGDVTTLCPAGEGGDASFRCGTAYEADPADWKTSGLRFHRNIATVNLTFPAVEPPPPPPAIGVTVYRTVDEKRVDTRGIVPAGTPLILAIKPSSKAVEVREVQVQGGAESFRADPLKGQPTGADWIVEYTPGTVGTYRVEVTGLGAKESGLPEAVKGGTTFRVIGAGGTDEIVEGARPEVIPARTSPKSGASGVQVSTFVQVVFTEPVRKISGNVVLKDAKGQLIAVKLSGVLRYGGVVEDLAQSPDAVITSLTVQPLSGLEYGATYRLELGDGIEDLDTTPCGSAPTEPPPCSLVPYDTQFTTFSPESLSTNPESFGSPGIVVLGERAYLVQNHFYAGTLRVFETTDPVSPLEIPNSDTDSRDPRYTVSYRPVDLVGETDSPLTGGRVVAVVTGPTAQSKPSNVWLLDVNDDRATQWIGAVSLTNSAAEGFVSRSFLRAGVLYAATFRKGIQVVDLGQVKDAFKAPGTPEFFQMSQAFLTDGRGYGQENVINIQVNSPFGGPARLNDIEAALTQTTDGAQLLVAAPGDPGLTVVNPATQSVLWNDKVTYEREVDGQKVVEATLRYGQAIGLGNVAGQDLAVVVGSGTILQETQSRPLLMVVSLYDPQNPVGLGYVQLDDASVGDVILKDDLALLGGSKQVTLVSLTDKTRPKILGTAPGVGGRLALGDNGSILFATERSVFGGTDLPLGGVRTAALGRLTYVASVKEEPVILALDRRSIEKQTIGYRALFPREEIETSELEISDGKAPVRVVPAPLDENSKGEIELPEGIQHPPAGSYLTARLVVNRQKPDEPLAMARALRNDSFKLEPSEPSRMSTDDDPLDIGGLSQALLSRLRKDPGYRPLPLSWALAGSPGGGALEKLVEASPTGLYTNSYAPDTDASAVNLVELRLGSTVLAHTSLIQNSPGRSWTATIHAGPPPQSPDLAFPPGTGLLPADGTTAIEIVLEDIRDRFGNLVADDSLVFWSAGDDAGKILTPETPISGGRSVMRYEAGTRPGSLIIRAELEQYPGAGVKAIAVQQAALDLTVTRDGTSYRAEVTSAAGLPANGTLIEWSTTLGAVSGALGLDEGVGTATYEPPQRAGGTLPRFAFVFATVGRSHNGVPYDLQSGKPGSKFSSNTTLVGVGGAGDASTSVVNSDVGQQLPLSTAAESAGSAMIHVEGGAPGETLRVALGSTRFPAHVPFAIYPLDSIEDDATPDTQGQMPAHVGTGVSLDQTTSAKGVASHHFTGENGLTIADAPPLHFPGDFGINGHVRFDSVDIAQTVFEKAGSYGLRLNVAGGQPRLEFYVRSAGLDRQVLSQQVVSPGVWYPFAAHLRGQRLRLGVGDSDLVQLGDEAPTVDVADAPLIFGATLTGNLDQVEIYDFTTAPFVTFANSETEMDVTLDHAGEADLPVSVFASLAQGAMSATLNAPGGTIDYNFSNGPRPVVIRRYEAPDPSQVQNESATWVFATEAADRIAACIGGIATGEAGGLLGAACDIVAGFNVFLTVPLAMRDLVVKTKHFIEGKRSKWDYVIAAGALVIIVASAIPVVRSVVKGLQRGEQALRNTSAAVKIAEKEAQLVEDIARTGASSVSKEGLIRILDSEDDVLRAALIGIETGVTDGAQTWDRLERLGKVFGHEELVQRLDGILNKFGRTPQTFARLETMIEALDRIGLAVGQKLSLETLEGIMHLMERAPSVGMRRIVSIWQTIPALAPAADQARVFQNVFEWIRAGEAAGMAKLPGWSYFLQTGIGSVSRSHPGSVTAQNAIKGAYHSLEFLAKDLKFSSNIVGIEVLEALSSRRRIDVLVQEGANLVKYELKNIASFTSEHAGQVVKDVAAIKLAIQRGGQEVTAKTLRDGLTGTLRYVFRGTKEQSVVVVTKLFAKLKEAVGQDAAHVVDELKDTIVKYTNRSLPI
jgi:hypothetical protein